MPTYFSRLRKKYGKENIRNKRYQKLVSEILEKNNQNVARAVGKITEDNYKKTLGRIPKDKAKTVKLPELSTVIPERSVFLLKAAQNGRLITERLRAQLDKDLRATLQEFDRSGKSRVEVQRGKTTGKINPELIKAFRERITDTYESRTKRDKKTGVPPNVKAIATTEIRSAVGIIKAQYKNKLLSDNPSLEGVKTWVHNKSLSKKPRVGHIRMNNKTLKDVEKFKVPRDNAPGFDLMDRPHDITAPPEQVISCNCDILYKVRIKV